jgi:hypothetical protein
MFTILIIILISIDVVNACECQILKMILNKLQTATVKTIERVTSGVPSVLQRSKQMHSINQQIDQPHFLAICALLQHRMAAHSAGNYAAKRARISVNSHL